MFLAKVIHADGFSRLAAVKLLHPKWSEDEEIASRMRDEARLLGWLRHKHIVDVIDLTRIDGRVAVLMEYLEAVDTRLVIQDCKERDDIVPMRVALEICSQAAGALDAAYNRPPYAGEKPLHVIHRDIKPSNIMIDGDGVSKVLDFGVARADFDSREAHTEEMSFGSLEYMPPERLFFEPDTPASDVYSLGATLFELLTLEKFGKARLKPNNHEEFILERLEKLLEVQLFDDAEVGEELLLLLNEMLAFDEKERPPASMCMARMRALAKLFPAQPTLAEWAEEEIPPLVQAFMARDTGDSSAMVGRVVDEDPSRVFPRAMTEEAPKPQQQQRGGHIFEDVEDEPTDPGGEDTAVELAMAEPARDARWEAIKEQTLRDREPPTVPGAPVGAAAGAGPMAAEAVSELDDEPTTAMRVPGGDPDTLPRKQPRASLEPPRELTDPTMEKIDPVTEEELAAHGSASASAAPAVLSAAPASPPGEPAEEKEGWLGAIVLLMVGLLLIGGLAFGGLTVIGGVVGVSVMGDDLTAGLPGGTAPTGSQAADSEPAEAPDAPADAGSDAAGSDAAEAPSPAEPDPAAAAPEGPATHFISHISDAKKLSVRCDNTKGSGVSDAWVQGEALGKCTVTGMSNDRKRLTAVVEGVEPREYNCFVEGAKACE